MTKNVNRHLVVPISVLLVSLRVAAVVPQTTPAVVGVESRSTAEPGKQLTIFDYRPLTIQEVGMTIKESTSPGTDGAATLPGQISAALEKPTGKHYRFYVKNETVCPFVSTGIEILGQKFESDVLPSMSKTLLSPGEQDMVAFTLESPPDAALGSATGLVSGYFECAPGQREPLSQRFSVHFVNPDQWQLRCDGFQKEEGHGTLRDPRFVSVATLHCTNTYPYPIKVIARILGGGNRFFFAGGDAAPMDASDPVAANKESLLIGAWQTFSVSVGYRPYLIGSGNMDTRKPGTFDAKLHLIPSDPEGRDTPIPVVISMQGRTFSAPVLWSVRRGKEGTAGPVQDGDFSFDFNLIPKNDVSDAVAAFYASPIKPYKITKWSAKMDGDPDLQIEAMRAENPLVRVTINPSVALGKAPQGTLRVTATVVDPLQPGAAPKELEWAFPIRAKIEKPVEKRGDKDIGWVSVGDEFVLPLPGMPSFAGKKVVGVLLHPQTGKPIPGIVVGQTDGKLTLRVTSEAPPQIKGLLSLQIGTENPDIVQWNVTAKVYTPIKTTPMLLGKNFFPGDETALSLPWPPSDDVLVRPVSWKAWIQGYEPLDKPWVRLSPSSGMLAAGILPPVSLTLQVPSDAKKGETFKATVMTERSMQDGSVQYIEHPVWMQTSSKTPWRVESNLGLHALVFDQSQQKEFLWFNHVAGVYHFGNLRDSSFANLSFGLIGGVSPSFKMAGAQLGLHGGQFFGKDAWIGIAGGVGLTFQGDFSDVVPSKPYTSWLFLDAKMLLDLGAKFPVLHGWVAGLGFNVYLDLVKNDIELGSRVHLGPIFYLQHRFGY